MGRPSPMHEEANRERVAVMYAAGATRAEIAEEFGGVDKSTVSAWLHREDVKALVDRKIRERTNRILRQTDSRIESALQDAENMSLEELLKVRKEFLPDRKEIKLTVNEDEALAELWKAAAEDPEAAQRILGLTAPDELT